MDILEAVLRNAKAEEHIEKFRKEGLDAATFPVLSNEDLEVIGVEDASARDAILKVSSKMQIPSSEKRVDTTITKEYVELVLNQVGHQLKMHHANLTCALIRKDLVVCNLQLEKTSACLLNCITSLENEVNSWERKLFCVQPQKKKKWGTLALLLISSTASFFICRKAITFFVE